MTESGAIACNMLVPVPQIRVSPRFLLQFFPVCDNYMLTKETVSNVEKSKKTGLREQRVQLQKA
ncbi:MAG: hypothetical protein VX962_04025, partial [Pseudomonadota bacterium]|nr:hypothetical protein [Pseudomonadota bacterium]